MKMLRCVDPQGNNLTLNNFYQIIDADPSSNRVKVIDDNNDVLWISADCFEI